MSLISAANAFVARNSRSGSYEIKQSLRFDGGSHLARTFGSTGNGRIWSLSVWLKRAGGIGDNDRDIFGAYVDGNSRIGLVECGAGPTPDLFGVDQGGPASNGSYYANGQRRDSSAWYHLVVSVNYNTPSVKIWVNGVLEGQAQNSLAADGGLINSASVPHHIGSRVTVPSGNNRWLGYMAEFHFLDTDSQLSDPNDFGEFDDNGVWRPIEYTGSYGDNGFYMKFDPSATNGIGHDHSGNGNHFTSNGGFTTSGTGTDVMFDTPTNNFATLNPLEPASASAGTLSDGNLYIANQDYSLQKATFRFGGGGPTTGKYYWEVTHTGGGPAVSYIGVTSNLTQDAGEIHAGGDKSWFGASATRKYDNTFFNQSHTYSSGDVYGYAIDLDAQEIKYYINGTLKFTDSTLPDPATTVLVPFQFTTNSGSGASWTNTSWNFGQRAFSHQPTGYSSLCTANLPAPDIADGSEYFDTFLYNGTNSSSASNKTGDFTWTPDFVWIKNRNGANSHRLVDAVRGTGKSLISNSTGAEVNSTTYAPTAFISGGYTTETSDNSINGLTSDTYVAWNWLASNTSGSSNTDGSITSTVSANPTAGFSIVTYTGAGTGATVGHGLGIKPELLLVKNRTIDFDWAVYHSALGGTKYLDLNTTDQAVTASGRWSDTDPTNTVFSVDSSNATGNASGNYVAYCFAEVEGYSKFGSYTGNNSSNGAFVYTGFAPAFVMIKANESANWVIYDTSRSPYNVADEQLSPNTSGNEVTNDGNADLLSNGFKLRNGAATTNAYTYVYAAFAENPFGGSRTSPATAR